MKLKTLAILFAVAGATLDLPVQAQAHAHSGQTGHGAPAAHGQSAQPSGELAGSPATLVDGEVRKIDRAAQKLTLRHGPIANLEMSPMTMVFRVADVSMLESVKTGDKVRFAAERMGGDLTVTRIEQAN